MLLQQLVLFDYPRFTVGQTVCQSAAKMAKPVIVTPKLEAWLFRQQRIRKGMRCQMQSGRAFITDPLKSELPGST